MIGMIPTHTLYLELRVIWGTKSFLRDCVRVCVRGGVLVCVKTYLVNLALLAF